jgi:hypothetical protein
MPVTQDVESTGVSLALKKPSFNADQTSMHNQAHMQTGFLWGDGARTAMV